MSDDRVVVIGAGASGLAAAVQLARRGVEVEVLEARCEPGGCASTTTVNGYTFTDGAVFIAVPQLLRRAFASIGMSAPLNLNRASVPSLSLVPDGSTISLGGPDIATVDGPDGASRTARLRDDVAALVRHWGPVLDAFVDHVIDSDSPGRATLRHAWRYLPQLRGTLAAELDRAIHEPNARAAVAAVSLYTGLAPQQTPWPQIFGVVSMVRDGFWVPRGGIGAITTALHDEAVRCGVTFRWGTQVDGLETRSGQITGVLAGERIQARRVIATAAGMLVTGWLGQAAPRPLRRRVSRAPLSHRAVSVQIGLRRMPELPAFTINRVPLMREQADVLRPGSRWLNLASPAWVDPSCAPPGGGTIEMYLGPQPRPTTRPYGKPPGGAQSRC